MNSPQSRLYRYGNTLNTHDLIKIIAILFMIVDHVGEFVFNDNTTCRLLGRVAAPLFFFLIGYTDKLRITTSLVLYGLIFSLSGSYLASHLWISILINFIVIHFLLKLYPIENTSTFSRSMLFLGASLATLITYHYLEYGFLGLMIAYAGRLVGSQDKQSRFWLALSLALYYLWESIYFHFTLYLNYLLLFGALMLVGYFMLAAYRLHEISTPKWLRLPGLLLSRYSLEIYFYHLIILQIYYAVKHHLF